MERTPFTSYLADLDQALRLMQELVCGVQAIASDPTRLPQVLDVAEALSAQHHELTLLTDVLREAYGAITRAVGDVRISREAICVHAADRLRRTHARLAEVTTATETATNRLLDGLDRALAMVDRLDGASAAGTADGDAVVTEVAKGLREQLNGLFEILQFQDITAQQLGAAGDLLEGVERRLEDVAALLEPDALLDGGDAECSRSPVNDSRASTLDAAARQRLADAVMGEALLAAAPMPVS
jgi:chemotaxis regulatin CheY-phosphate phosphatase CheZ